MFIKRITQIEEVLRIVPIENELREKEGTHIKTQEMLSLINSQLNNPLFYLIYVYEDKTEANLMGYIIFIVIPIKLMDMKSLNILRIYYNHKYYKDSNIQKTGWEIIEHVAKQYDIHKIRIEVSRGVKAYQKKWKFKPMRTVMEREV